MSATAEKGEKKKGKLPLPIIIGVVAVLVGLFIGKSVLGGSKADPKEDKKKKHEQEVGITLPLDEFLVNLNGQGEHYLRATLALGLKKDTKEEEMKEKVAVMRDAVLSELRTKHLKDFTKDETMDTLKGELKDKLNEALGDEVVVKVYFTAFATQ